jgi:2-dehydropantoate 2-reductase
MNVLIIGTGVVGTIYGWALKEGGINVTHIVRTNKPDLAKNGANIDILDERKGFKKYNQTNYPITITDNLETDCKYDLVIVPTNCFQTESVLKSIVPKCRAYFFISLLQTGQVPKCSTVF